LAVQLGHRLLQHLAVARVAGALELLGEALPGKKEAIAFPVALLLFGRDLGVDAACWGRSFLLLLFYRLTLPPASHLGNLTSKFDGNTKKHLACDPCGRVEKRGIGGYILGKTASQNLRGLPNLGRTRSVPSEGTTTC
jgi:hypothetical protein